MIIIFRPYAMKRMSQRGITEAQVRLVLKDFQHREDGNQPSTIRYVGVAGMSPRELSVVVEDPGVAADPVVVVTTYWE